MKNLFIALEKYLMIFFLFVFQFFAYDILYAADVASSEYMNNAEDLSDALRWSHKLELIINNKKIAGDDTLLDVPIMISAPSIDNSVFAGAKPDGCDIRFSRSGDQENPEELPFEKVTYSPDGETAEFWVKRDLDPNEQNSIWIWWGNTDAPCYEADSMYGSYNVWKEGFRSVLHLEEDGNMSAHGYKDSSKYRKSATGIGAIDSASDVALQIGNGQNLNGDDGISWGNGDVFEVGAVNSVYMSAWVDLNVADTYSPIISHAGHTDWANSKIWMRRLPDNTIDFGIRDTVGIAQARCVTDNKYETGRHYLAFVYDHVNKNVIGYINGEQVAIANNPLIGLINLDSGTRGWNRIAYDTAGYANIGIDEVRMYTNSDAISSEQIQTEYNNQSNPSTFIHPAEEEGLQPVILIPGTMGSFRKKGELRLDPILHTYDQLWDALLAAGYEDGKTLFAFPYEWRDSNVTNAEKLDIKIEEAKAAAGTRQVDIVAHSMGGIVSRAYVQGDAYDDDVDQIIFLGTPQRGAPLAYAMWQAGEFGKALEDKVLKRIFAHEAHAHGYEGDNDVYDYAHGRPIASLPELLPVYDYLQDQGQSDMRHYPDNYPANPLLSVLDQEESLARLDAVDTLEIIGDYENETWQSYIVGPSSKPGLWSYGMPVDYYDSYDGILRGAGDGTVPHESNLGFCDDSITLAVKHRKLPTAAREYVIEAFEQTPISLADGADYDRLLMVRIMSPADFLVIAPDGKTLGKDFSSNAVSEEIVSGYYSGFDTEVEFATIANPASGDYRIKLQGIADGDYTLIVSYLGDEIEVDREYKGTIKNGQLVEFVISMDEGSDSIGELLPWNGFERFRHDLEKKHAEDGVNEKVYKDLAKDINRLEAWYEKALVEKREWKQNLEFKLIRLHLEIMRANLKFYAHKKWISADAEVLLQGDITIIKNML